MSIGELLTQWLAGVAPTRFTHGQARKGIEIARNTALLEGERAQLSHELSARCDAGWLVRVGDGGRKNWYDIVKRPEVAKVVKLEERRERPPRRVTKELFHAFLLAFLGIIDSRNHETRRNGVRVVRMDSILNRTKTLTVPDPVRVEEIAFELADAISFGLFWYANDFKNEVFWRPSTDVLLLDYRGDLHTLVDRILTSTRASRERAASER